MTDLGFIDEVHWRKWNRLTILSRGTLCGVKAQTETASPSFGYYGLHTRILTSQLCYVYIIQTIYRFVSIMFTPQGSILVGQLSTTITHWPADVVCGSLAIGYQLSFRGTVCACAYCSPLTSGCVDPPSTFWCLDASVRVITGSRELSLKSSTDTTFMELNTLSTEVIYSGARIFNEKKLNILGTFRRSRNVS